MTDIGFVLSWLCGFVVFVVLSRTMRQDDTSCSNVLLGLVGGILGIALLVGSVILVVMFASFVGGLR